MMELIRSPLQFVRRMTEQEWQELVLRAANREIRRERKRRAKQKAAHLATASSRRLASRRLAQAADSSGVL